VTSRRHIIGWAGTAAAALVLLTAILIWQQRQTAQRFTVYHPPKPVEGRLVFEQKGCASCHGDNGLGSSNGPGLRSRAVISSLPQLVTAMWNHAPRMFDAMAQQKVAYPDFTYEDTARLLSYLYMSGYADTSGDVENGRKLFVEKHCIRCHSTVDRSGGIAPAIPKMSDSVTPLGWTQSLWNHASTMQTKMKQQGVDWPQLQANDLRDLFTYVRHASGHDGEFPFPAANPENGWAVFQRKQCVQCHSLHAGDPSSAPSLGTESTLPATYSDFGAAMLNHYPRMRARMEANGTPMPVFHDLEMYDLVAFLYSLHYLEPPGSPQIGGSVFSWRGCAHCHGSRAEGTRIAPPLRGRGVVYTSTRLATNLWRHGNQMIRQSQQLGQRWPELKDTDVGDLLAFLNSPLEEP
jgi:mono/diheme cytochrome c family protein